MKSNLYKSLLGTVIGASMLSLNSCTDLSETIYSELASEKYEFKDKDAAAMFAPVYSSLRSLYWGWNGYSIHRLTICGLNGNMLMKVLMLAINFWRIRLYRSQKYQLHNFVLIVHCIITFCLICSVTFHWILRMIIRLAGNPSKLNRRRFGIF